MNTSQFYQVLFFWFFLLPFAQSVSLNSNDYTIANGTFNAGGGMTRSDDFQVKSTIEPIGGKSEIQISSDNYVIHHGFIGQILDLGGAKTFDVSASHINPTASNDGTADHFRVRLGPDGSRLEIFLDVTGSNGDSDQLVLSKVLGGIDSIRLLGSTDNDALVLDHTNGVIPVEINFSGGEGVNTQNFNANFDLPISKGWNLVSLPFVNEFGIDTLLNNFVGGSLWVWDGSSYQTAATLQSQTGTWFFSHASGSVSFTGSGEMDSRKPLHKNWNLIGLETPPPYANSAIPIKDYISTGTSFEEPVWMWDGSLFKVAQSFSPGKGYWIYQIDLE